MSELLWLKELSVPSEVSLLKDAVRTLDPRQRVDSLSDRDLADAVLDLLGVDVNAVRTGNDQLVRERADAYVIAYAARKWEQHVREGDEQDPHERRRARVRADQARLAKLSIAPLSATRPGSDGRAAEPQWTDEERKLPIGQRPLPNSAEMRRRRGE